MPLPSEIPFCSFLQYQPRGDSEDCKRGRRYRDAIKNDSSLHFKKASGGIETVRGIDHFVKIIAQNIARIPEFRDALGPETVLVPIPRSAPLKTPSALWPARRICEALVGNGLGLEVVPLLERHTAVQKSATALPGQRPDPIDHYNSTSIAVGLPLIMASKITLVDDFITRGSHFLGMYPLVKAAYGDREIFCFAMMRTNSYEDVSKHMLPVGGTIRNNHGTPRRQP